MNPTAFNLADRNSKDLYEARDFYKIRVSRNKKVLLGTAWLVKAGLLSLYGAKGSPGAGQGMGLADKTLLVDLGLPFLGSPSADIQLGLISDVALQRNGSTSVQSDYFNIPRQVQN